MLDNDISILTPEEAAEYLRIGMNTMYNLLNSKKIKAYRVGRSWKIPKENLNKYIRESCCK